MDDQIARIVEARMNLRARFLHDVEAKPSIADERPTHALDGNTANLPLAEALKADALLVHTVNGQPLPVEHAGPCRIITPQLYAWKGARWISEIEVLERDPAFGNSAATRTPHILGAMTAILDNAQ